VDCWAGSGEWVTKSVKPPESSMLNGVGDMEENMVSKMSKLLFSSPLVLDTDFSRQLKMNGSLKSNRPPVVDEGVKEFNAEVEVEEGMVVLNPFVEGNDGT
jgi:hypothetical protein